MDRVRQFLYRLQHHLAITKQESAFLLVCMLLAGTGLLWQYVVEPGHPAPDAHALAEQRFQERLDELADARREALEEGAATEVEDLPEIRSTGAPVNVNDATASELERLPGIGPALAERIILYRESVGYFRREDELLNVSGIGPATLERMEPQLTLGGE